MGEKIPKKGGTSLDVACLHISSRHIDEAMTGVISLKACLENSLMQWTKTKTLAWKT